MSSEKRLSREKKLSSEKKLSCEKKLSSEKLMFFVVRKEKSFLVIEAKEVRTVEEVIRSDGL